MANTGFDSTGNNPLHNSFGLGRYVGRIVDALRRRAEYRAAYRRTLAELQTMSDRELSEFGFHRSELPDIARRAVQSG